MFTRCVLADSRRERKSAPCGKELSSQVLQALILKARGGKVEGVSGSLDKRLGRWKNLMSVPGAEGQEDSSKN